MGVLLLDAAGETDQAGICACGGKNKEMHSTAVIKRDFCIWVKINVKAGIKSAIHVKYTL